MLSRFISTSANSDLSCGQILRCQTLRKRVILCICAHLTVALFGATKLSAEEHVVRATRQAIVALKGRVDVDGKVDSAWNDAPIAKINNFIPSGSDEHSESVGATGTVKDNRATAEVRLLWDDGQLFAMFEVADPELNSSSPDPWQQDSVEWFVDSTCDRRSSYGEGDAQVRVNFDGKVSGGTGFDPNTFRAVARTMKGGYRVEAAWRLPASRLRAGSKVGVEFQVNDNRTGNGRESIAKWAHADDESFRNTSRFGTVVLVEEASDAEAALQLATEALELHGDSANRNENTSGVSMDDSPRSIDRAESEAAIAARMPDWAADAIFYQIFPERFRNGDASNDPTRGSLEFPDIMPDNWQVTRWTSDWYARDDWEKKLGPKFYESAVFHRRYGGDLQGVLDKLDYLKQLGVNTLYFNPVFYARSLHKYDGNSFHHVDPHFGPDPDGDFDLMKTENSDPKSWKWTAADKLFLQVVREAHQRDMRVIIDGVFNHTGRDFFAFEDIVTNQQKSPYTDWYVIQEFDDPTTKENELKYQCWWGVDTLPEFANNEDGSNLHPGPKKYIFDATKRWMDPNGDGDCGDGIDGWRLDVANEVPDEFWVEWNGWVRTINPQAYTVSEIWERAADYLDRCGFSASMNYHAFAFVCKGFLLDGKMPASQFAAEIERRRQEHPWRIQLGMQNLFDSHDTDRLASMIVNAPADRAYVKPVRADYDIQERSTPRHWDAYLVRKPNEDERRIQRLATLFQLSYVGAPMLYYGSEAGMWGADDPCDRKPMVWADLTYDEERSHPLDKKRPADAVEFDSRLFQFHQNAIDLRNNSKAIRHGTVLAMTGFDSAKCVAMLRRFENEWSLTVLNRSTESQEIRLPALDFAAPSDQAEVLSSSDEEPATFIVGKQSINVAIPRLSTTCWTWAVEQ